MLKREISEKLKLWRTQKNKKGTLYYRRKTDWKNNNYQRVCKTRI